LPNGVEFLNAGGRIVTDRWSKTHARAAPIADPVPDELVLASLPPP
jgi:hypothetical protein